MLPLLKLIPLKDWVYGGIVVALLVCFGVYTHHERVIGEQKIETQDKALADAQKAKNKEIENGIANGIQTAVDKWKQAHPIPAPAPVPHLLCHAASGSGSVPKGGSPASSSNGAGTTVPVSPEQVDEGFDPAIAVSATGTAADTEIVRLKAKVTLLQDTIKAYQSGGIVQGN